MCIHLCTVFTIDNQNFHAIHDKMETRQAINRCVIELDLCAKFEKLSVKTIQQSGLHRLPYIVRYIMAEEPLAFISFALFLLVCRKVQLLIMDVFDFKNANAVEYFIKCSL